MAAHTQQLSGHVALMVCRDRCAVVTKRNVAAEFAMLANGWTTVHHVP